MAWGQAVTRWAKLAIGPDTSSMPDGELCARFAATRDQAAFELLVWRHAAMVLRTALSVTRDHHLAEDVSQPAFLVLARQVGRLREPNAAAGFLHTTAHRMALRAIRLRQVSPLPPDLPATPTDPDDGTAALLHEEVARLPAAWRSAVLLCFFEGLTHAEAAQRLGKPVGSVAGWLARAKTTLHDRLPAAGLAALASVGRTDASFVEAVTAASLAYAGGTPPASPLVLTLVSGATTAMFLAKLKVATVATVVAFSGVGITAGGYAFVQAQGSGLPGGPPGGASAPPGYSGGGTLPSPTPKAVDHGSEEKSIRRANFQQILRSQKNLKRLSNGLLNHESAMGHFPTDIVAQNTRTPLLSWRVAILPHIGEEKLYAEFKLTEPWDSEHNFKLLSKMPEVLRVGFEPKEASHTYYQVVKAPGAALFPVVAVGGEQPGMAPPGGFGAPPGFPAGGGSGFGPGMGGPGASGLGPVAGGPGMAGRGAGSMGQLTFGTPKMFNVTDGTSNTIGVVECGPAVPWTKPADLDIARLDEPLPKLAWPFENVLNVSFMDGHISTFRKELPEPTLRAMLTAGAGDVFDAKKFVAKVAATTGEEKALVAAAVEEQQKLAEAILAETREYLKLKAADTDLLSIDATNAELNQILAQTKGQNKALREAKK
jgi:RNA polymerase sigma factor (sigma-70 family)